MQHSQLFGRIWWRTFILHYLISVLDDLKCNVFAQFTDIKGLFKGAHVTHAALWWWCRTFCRDLQSPVLPSCCPGADRGVTADAVAAAQLDQIALKSPTAKSHRSDLLPSTSQYLTTNIRGGIPRSKTMQPALLECQITSKETKDWPNGDKRQGRISTNARYWRK